MSHHKRTKKHITGLSSPFGRKKLQKKEFHSFRYKEIFHDLVYFNLTAPTRDSMKTGVKNIYTTQYCFH